jgi:hypothetical protein
MRSGERRRAPYNGPVLEAGRRPEVEPLRIRRIDRRPNDHLVNISVTGAAICWALREIPARLLRTAVMSSNLIGLVIAALGTIVTVAVAVGLPALAIVAVRFFKFKERELTLEMEHRQKSQQHELAIEQQVQGVEQRVQRLEEVLASLDHDVRDRLGIQSSPATSLSSHPELVEGPATSDAQREESQESVLTKSR